jgi:hypothetical protein
MVPEFICDRIRTAPPADAPVVSGSTPIVCFGNAENAEIATLSLNPSNKEFVDVNGDELSGENRRLETLGSLGIDSLQRAPDEAVEAIYKECIHYFDRNPYASWFDQLEAVLDPLDASYYEGSATHLDFVQWATSEKWGDLSSKVKTTLLDEDVPFLRKQLQEGKYEFILLNGREVMNTFAEQFEVDLSVRDRIDRISNNHEVEICTGSLPMGSRVIGWSTSLQSTFGLTNDVKGQIAERVQDIVA